LGRLHYFELDSLIGTTFDGRYKIGALLGEGGQAGVFRAWDIDQERTVALKVLRPDSAEGGSRYKRFEREAYALMQLHHKNCVSVHHKGFDADHGLHYMAMDLVQGQPLDLFVRFPMTLRQVVRTTQGIAAGLGEAHRIGIMHRDLKPENVVLTPQGTDIHHLPILLDFGIAKFDENYQMTMLTGSEMVLGTVHYMSPEQAQGYALAPMTDIYSLGVLLYELMTGDPPFDGSPIQILRQHIARPIPPMVTKPSAGPSPELSGVLDKMLAKRPADRFEDGARCASVLAELQQRLDGRPEYASGTWLDAHVGRGLVAIGYASGDVEVRELDSGRRVFRRAVHPESVVQLAFTADGNELLTIGLDGALCVVGASDGAVRWSGRPTESSPTALAVSPVGALYAVASDDGRIRVLPIGADAALAEFRSHRGPIRRMIFDPTGCTLVSGGEDGAVLVWDVGQTEVRNRFAVEGTAATALALDIASGLLAMGSDTGRITIGDLDGERRPDSFFAHAAAVSGLAFLSTPSGELDLFSSGYDGELRQWSAADCRSRPHAGLHPEGIRCAWWFKDGAMLALCDSLVMRWEKNFYDESGGVPDRYLSPIAVGGWCLP